MWILLGRGHRDDCGRTRSTVTGRGRVRGHDAQIGAGRAEETRDDVGPRDVGRHRGVEKERAG